MTQKKVDDLEKVSSLDAVINGIRDDRNSTMADEQSNAIVSWNSDVYCLSQRQLLITSVNPWTFFVCPSAVQSNLGLHLS
jgi:hypothetical protein